MNSVKDWTRRGLSALVPAIALAAPAFAQEPAGLADPSQPGSVLVWPKFTIGTVAVNPGTPGAFTAAKTLIELGAVCPAAAAPCADNQTVHVHLHWVCPGLDRSFGEIPSVCPETDFNVAVTYGTSSAGKITFNPGNGTSTITGPAPSDYNGSTIVEIAPCPRGYLIGYAVDTFDRPIKFDGLIGDTVQRSFGPDLQSESAIAIQADPDLATNAQIALGPQQSLVFDGGPGHYRMVTGQLQGDVSFDSNTTAPFHSGALILLTLDVHSGLSNNPTAVAFKFYNFFESELSTNFAFTCWGQVELAALDPNLTVELFGSQTLLGTPGARHDKGLVISGQAIDEIEGTPVTLLGLFQASEGSIPGPANAVTSYTVRPGNNSKPIPTRFFPLF
jgi:hypothetical protein